MTDPLLDENNNNPVDLDSVKLLDLEANDDASDHGSSKAYSVSTTSAPPDDPEAVAVPQLRCQVQKLEAEVDNLKSQLSRFAIRDDADHGRPERERCVVFKCIPQAHVASDLIITRVSEFFKIAPNDLSLQVTDQLNKWCVVVLHTPSRHHASTILRKFGDFRKLYHCYHRTQALPCFSTAERLQYQQLWAEAIERNNRAGYRLWEVDPHELKVVEAVGVPQKWRVKVHYFPDSASPTASTSAIEVRRRQRIPKSIDFDGMDQQSPKASEASGYNWSRGSKTSTSPPTANGIGEKKKSSGQRRRNGGGRRQQQQHQDDLYSPAFLAQHYMQPPPYYYHPAAVPYSSAHFPFFSAGGEPVTRGGVVCITSNGLNTHVSNTTATTTASASSS